MIEVVKKTSKKLGIEEDIVETIIRHKYQWLREQMKNPSGVAVLDNYFATWEILKSQINKALKKNVKAETKEKFKQYLNPVSAYLKKQKENGKKRNHGKKKNNER